MKRQRFQFGLTLMEMITVIAVVAVLALIAIPAIKTLIDTQGTVASAKAVISSAIASARAIAAREQKYAGIRFQYKYDPCDPQYLHPQQYMIFIVQEPNMNGLTIGFKAVEGTEIIKLPSQIGVADLMVTDLSTSKIRPLDVADIGNWVYMTDTSTFSIIFSTSGKLVRHDVRTRNRDGIYNPANLDESSDDIFNSPINIKQNHTGTFLQDDYPNFGFGEEQSRASFVIYDRDVFNRLTDNVKKYEYLNNLSPDLPKVDIVRLNTYTGTIIEER